MLLWNRGKETRRALVSLLMLFSLLSTSSSRFGASGLARATFTSMSMSTPAASAGGQIRRPNLVIDSHLHVWANEAEAKASSYPYAEGQTPPDSLINAASVKSLLTQMELANVDGALIVQPINHKFDHSYVAHAISSHPDKFKGMLLHDPSLSKEDALLNLEELLLQGFVGVRFNPYLWPSNKEDGHGPQNGRLAMSSDPAGMAVFQRCGELNMPVGIMCFKGLHLHYDDIVQLLEASPKTICILDHFGFTGFTEQGNANFQSLLELGAKYPNHNNVIVKLSALFRIAGEEDSFPYYRKVQTERFEPLLKAFGPHRLMMGTDFPFVTETEGGYQGAVQTVHRWCQEATVKQTDTDLYNSPDEARHMIMGGTAERVFGPWYR
jgi:predicted TIM-barrel fold metal-dependent hydrolase